MAAPLLLVNLALLSGCGQEHGGNVKGAQRVGSQATATDTVPTVTGQILFRPAATDQAKGTSYTRVIRLTNSSSANGRLLATFEYFQQDGFPIYESLDDGQTWSSSPVATARDSVHPSGQGWTLEWQPDLFELPQQVGDLPAGTLLLAGNAIRTASNGDVLEQQLQLYASADVGRTWTYRSTFVVSPVNGGGVWEPNLQVSQDGRLVVFYSSERHKDQGYNQLLAHKVSGDGGKTWGDEVYDVATTNSSLRPGMAVVKRLPNGRYMMSFEVVGESAAQAHVKFSDDGLSWGDASSLGSPVRASNGNSLGATPYITWSSAGGSNGTLIASGQNNTGASDRRLFLNTNLGQGDWLEITAPVQWQGGNDHAGWSQGLLASADGSKLLQLASSSIGTDLNEIRYATVNLDLKEPTTSGAALASWGTDRLSLYTRGAGGSIYERYWSSGGGWSGWQDMGAPSGGANSAPSAYSRTTNYTDLFVRGVDGQLYTKTWNGSAWSAWNAFGAPGGVASSAPVVSGWGTDRLNVYVRGGDNRIYERYWSSGGGWSGWQDMGAPSGGANSAPSAYSRTTNYTDLFVRGVDGQLYTKTWNGSAWSAWNAFGAP